MGLLDPVGVVLLVLCGISMLFPTGLHSGVGLLGSLLNISDMWQGLSVPGWPVTVSRLPDTGAFPGDR